MLFRLGLRTALSFAFVFICLRSGAVVMPSDSEFSAALDGTWRIKIEQNGSDEYVPAAKADWRARAPVQSYREPEPFHHPNYKEDNAWKDIKVPGNWEMAGLSPATYHEPDNSSALYRKWIQVPSSWRGRKVLINFDGVQNGAEVWLNGLPVDVDEPSAGRRNYHESGFTAWQADITPHVRHGERNLLAVRVLKNTASASLDSGDYFFLGGIYRTVTLFSVPQLHITDFETSTRLIGSDAAEWSVRVHLSDTSASGTVTVRLNVAGSPLQKSVGAVSNSVLLKAVLQNPPLWSAEHPNLHDLEITLTDSIGKKIETVRKRIGLCETLVRNGVFLVNGVPVKLTGMCRHDVHPDAGTAVGHELWRKDIELMKAANVNAVRTSHYPYGSGFYDVCDELGMYVVNELPYCWCKTDDPADTPAFLQRARETLRRDRNHPSVIIWAVANETPKGQNLQHVTDLIKAADPGRPVAVSRMKADEYGADFDDLHYTVPNRILQTANDTERRSKWPHIYLECPNVWDVRLGVDSGCLDAWGEVLMRTWEPIWNTDGITGAFLWEWQDRAVADECTTKPYELDAATGVQYFKTKGVVDGYRNPRPNLYHVKMVYAPIKVAPLAERGYDEGTLLVTIRNHYSFTNLDQLKTAWTLLKSGKSLGTGSTKLSLSPRTTETLEMTLPVRLLDQADAVRLEFFHSSGRNIVSVELDLGDDEYEEVAFSEIPPPGSIYFPRFNLVTNVTKNDKAKWRSITRHAGRLGNLRVNGSPAADVSTTPLHTVAEFEADIFVGDETVSSGRVTAQFENGRFHYRVNWTAGKTDVQELGWKFDMSSNHDVFSWDRCPVWSVYPSNHIGRPRGSARPDSMNVALTKWNRPDAFDFNSTKYHCNWATLADSGGTGLRIDFTPGMRHNVRAGKGGRGFELVVNRQCSPPRDISSKTVSDLYLELKPGSVLDGAMYLSGAGK